MPTTLFGLTIADGGLAEALRRIQDFVRSGGSHLVATVNPEILVYAHQHPTYRLLLQGASLLLPDGTGVVLASHLTAQPLRHGRVTGVDLVESIIQGSCRLGYSIFLVGEYNDVLQKATLNFINKYGKVNIVGYCEGPRILPEQQFPIDDQKNDELLGKLLELKPDILLVGFGHPKQEQWLSYYLPKLPVKVGIGVGGSFDYFAGLVVRPYKLLRLLGLEWLGRLIAQPWRWKRIYHATVVFSYLVLKQRLSELFHVEQS